MPNLPFPWWFTRVYNAELSGRLCVSFVIPTPHYGEAAHVPSLARALFLLPSISFVRPLYYIL